MSAAPAAEAAAPPAKGNKKLIIIIAAAALVLGGGGGAAVMLMKKKPPADAEGAEDHAPPPKAAHSAAPKFDPKAVPVFLPLEPFTVNLADRNAERFAQVAVTLEIEDAKLGDQIKAYMPAIRHSILMAIADRSAGELLGREGKVKLAEKVRRETSRVLGVELDDEDEVAPEDGDPAKAEKPAKPGKKAKKRVQPTLPIKAVHFSNFIIQ